MAKFLVIFVLLVLLLVPSCRATVYTVGDSAGWDISADLSDWPSKKIFEVGDILWFQYSSYHSVNEVDKDGYDSCNTTNAILTSHDGNTSVPLTSPGDRYFICGVLLHCLGGMKIHVTVQRAPSPASAPASQFPEIYDPNSPPLHGAPSTKNNNPVTPLTSGCPYAARNSKLVAWLCSSIGALWWMLLVSV